MAPYWKIASRKLLLLTLLPLLGGLFVTVKGWLWFADTSAFAANLRHCEGHIRAMESNDGKLNLDVEYADEEGKLFRTRLQVDESKQELFKSTGFIALAHDRRDPRRVAMSTIAQAGQETVLSQLMLAAGFGIIGYGIWQLLRHHFQVRRWRRLFTSGLIALTEVREVAQLKGASRGQFSYAFRGKDGRWYEGSSPEFPSSELASWPVGRPIAVAYDAADPKRNVVDVFGRIALFGRRNPADPT